MLEGPLQTVGFEDKTTWESEMKVGEPHQGRVGKIGAGEDQDILLTEAIPFDRHQTSVDTTGFKRVRERPFRLTVHGVAQPHLRSGNIRSC